MTNNFLKATKNISNMLEDVLIKFPIKKIIDNLLLDGAQVFLVGGAVRDMILGHQLKDLDIEIHRLSVKQVEHILQRYGNVDLVGKSFGVFRICGLDVDWSLPRIDESGRKPTVHIDPSMDIEVALRRRDLTMNAMAIDFEKNELIDPFDGIQDMQDKILRTPDVNFFVEDPLRFFRVMQFIGRFKMFPDKELNNVCKSMDFSKVSCERIEQEFEKLLLKGEKPSLAIEWLNLIGRLKDVLPELADLIGIEQGKKTHPEGDAYEHVKQVLDVAAKFLYRSRKEKQVLMYTALAHDLGKKPTFSKEGGKIKFIGHEIKGIPLAKKMLKRITKNKGLIEKVSVLIRHHLRPADFVRNGAKDVAYKRLAYKLSISGLNMKILAKLSRADVLGRAQNPEECKKLRAPEVAEFLRRANRALVLHKPEEPILKGRDLLDVMEPGPELGRLLKKAYELQIEKGIKDKEKLKKNVLILIHS